MELPVRGESTIDAVPARAPALDGMRALFVLGVIAYHLWSSSHHWSIDTGGIGVVGFFALSGYLITGLLLKEHAATGRVHMRYFYARRALRLMPALLFFLAVWFLVDIVFQHGQFLATVPSAATPGSPVSSVTGLEAVGAALLYVTNWMDVAPISHLWHGYSPISHLWTLAVEEQFYVLWAPVMLLLLRLRRRWATLIVATIVVGALLDPVFLSSTSFNRVYFGTDARCGALFCGALCAFIGSTGGWRFLRSARWVPILGAALVALIGWSIVALREEGHRGVWNGGLIVGSLACALAVAYVAERPRHLAATLLASELLVDIGRRSYALYLWSYVLNTWLRDTGPFETSLVLLTSFLAAEISYRLVELPALRFKHHFSASESAPTNDLGLDPALLVLSASRADGT
jgi:peptidoglycan/LPS O-acetylase OafA/YrhL